MSSKKTSRDYQLKHKYGITEAEYQVIQDAQNNKCAICNFPPKIRRLAVDHDHKTGEIRGLLCHNCNRGLRWFRDNAEYLEKASQYLRKEKLKINNEVLIKPQRKIDKRTKKLRESSENKGYKVYLKLSPLDIEAIRKLYKSKKYKQAQIAKMFGIKQPVVSMIVGEKYEIVYLSK